MPPGSSEESRTRWGMVWLISFAAWTFLAFFYAVLRYKWLHDSGMPAHFWSILYIPLVNYWIGAVSTPGIYWLVKRFPIEASNWTTRVPLHMVGSLVFTAVHVVVRMLVLPIHDEYGHVLPSTVKLGWRLFLTFTYDDALTTYWPILVLVQMLDFHHKSRQKELQASQLEAELAKAHLQTLKTQLRPHFLFNTLNSISALMHINVKAADQMISELSDLLRMSLESGDMQESTVRQELEFLQGFLRIEQTRFSDRLSVEFDIDPETYDAKLPHMLMQPLVENAIRHGISKRVDGGKIEIGAHRIGGQLVVSITDNGCGFSLEEVIRRGEGVGLRNTRERIRQLYGKQHELSTMAREGGGVQVRVSLPFVVTDTGTEIGREYVPVFAGPISRGGALHGDTYGTG